jgi:carbon-monoxide dehydrogenase small subunit
MSSMAAARQIRMTVNGASHEAWVEPRTTLADFLRGQLGLTGTHIGCEHGVCGICNVLMNGRAVRSCLTLAVQADGAELMTVEGLAAADGKLHPIQEAFVEEHGLQCGFCTPGFLIAIYELLESNQMCRCTGYHSILRAVHSAAAKLGAARSSEGAAG